MTASYITTSAVGNDLADLTVGNVAINGNVTMAGYTHIIGASGYTAGLQIYPGSVIDGSAQLDYCLAAHPSHCLWCNTGMFISRAYHNL